MTERLDIAFFGSSLVSAYWNGAATYYRGMIRALHELGHRITFYEPDAFDRQKHRDLADPPWCRVHVYDSQGTDGVYDALRQARNAGVIVKASGVGVHDELLEREVLDIRKPGAMAAFWDVDAPATLDSVANNPNGQFASLIPEYDIVFTYGGGDPVVSAYKANGARECVPVYNALDPETHYPVAPEDRFAAEIGFLGNRLPDREARVEEFFLNAASVALGSTFLLGGSGWHDKPMPSNVHYVGHVYTADHNAFNCSTRAVLNISRDSMARYGFSPATRVFEAAGAAACLITDWWEGIELFFEPQREILIARSGEDVAAQLQDLTPARAQLVGRAAYQRALAQHTYTHRAKQVDAILTGSRMTVGAH